MLDVKYKYVDRKNGFSLVELMVVVAIIGTLAAVGIPLYSKYKQKAYSAEAKASLSNLYVSEHIFFLEYGAYHTSFDAIGFTPPARGRYNVGFGDVGDVANASNGFYTVLSPAQLARISTKTVCSGGFATGTDSTCSLIADAESLPAPMTITANGFTAAASTPDLVAQETFQFTPGASAPAWIKVAAILLYPEQVQARDLQDGDIHLLYMAGDSWSIDQDKNLTHSVLAKIIADPPKDHTPNNPTLPTGPNN